MRRSSLIENTHRQYSLLLKVISIALLFIASGQAKTVNMKPVLLKDPVAVLKFVRGEVMIVGASFPSLAFQKGILSLLRSQTITKLTVLTTAQKAATYAPLRALGAQVYYLPTPEVNMTGSVLFAGENTAVMSRSSGEWYVVHGAQVGAQGRSSMNIYMELARKY
jgi:hypothetical protein